MVDVGWRGGLESTNRRGWIGRRGGRGGCEAEGRSALGLAQRVVRHVERDSGRFVVWHVEAATVPRFRPIIKQTRRTP